MLTLTLSTIKNLESFETWFNRRILVSRESHMTKQTVLEKMVTELIRTVETRMTMTRITK